MADPDLKRSDLSPSKGEQTDKIGCSLWVGRFPGHLLVLLDDSRLSRVRLLPLLSLGGHLLSKSTDTVTKETPAGDNSSTAAISASLLLRQSAPASLSRPAARAPQPVASSSQIGRTSSSDVHPFFGKGPKPPARAAAIGGSKRSSKAANLPTGR